MSYTNHINTKSMSNKICTSCFHYYEIGGIFVEKRVCRSPHLAASPVDGKRESSAERERTCLGHCGEDGEYFELCRGRMAKGWFGTIYDESASRWR